MMPSSCALSGFDVTPNIDAARSGDATNVAPPTSCMSRLNTMSTTSRLRATFMRSPQLAAYPTPTSAAPSVRLSGPELSLDRKHREDREPVAVARARLAEARDDRLHRAPV